MRSDRPWCDAGWLSAGSSGSDSRSCLRYCADATVPDAAPHRDDGFIKFEERGSETGRARQPGFRGRRGEEVHQVDHYDHKSLTGETKRLGRPRRECRSLCHHGGGHQLSIRRHIVQFFRRLERFALHGIRGFRIPTVNGRSEAANF